MNNDKVLNLVSCIAEQSQFVHTWDEFKLPNGDALLSMEAYFPVQRGRGYYKHPEVTPSHQMHYTIHLQEQTKTITTTNTTATTTNTTATLYAEALGKDEAYTFPAEDTPQVTLTLPELLETLFYLLLNTPTTTTTT